MKGLLGILLIVVLVLPVLGAVGAIGCGGEEEPTPELTCIQMQMAVKDHLDAMSTSYHARQVFAEFLDARFSPGIPQCERGLNEGYVVLYIGQSHVEGNSLLEPIFRNPGRYCNSADSFWFINPDRQCPPGYEDLGVLYSTEWVVTWNGEVSTITGNAIRLEAELGLIP